MKQASDRILTSHVGSLPRPDDLLPLILDEDHGRIRDRAAFEAAVAEAITDVVARQVDLGIDVVCDGEISKSAYTFYVRHRLAGIGSEPPAGVDKVTPNKGPRDAEEFPEVREDRLKRQGRPQQLAPAMCNGPVSYKDLGPLERDIANLHAAAEKAKPFDVFMNAASPGVLAYFIVDAYYNDEDKYVAALADAMKVEYEAIHAAGFVLQIDCPDLAMTRHGMYQDFSDADFVKIAERNVEAINYATANIPSEAMRMHLCWGNYPGPHVHDIDVAKIMDVVVKGRPQAISFEAANPRHEHEWADWKAARIPDDKILMPGVIDSTTNIVEHPRLVAERIGHFVDIVGPERVIAGTDCGFGTFAGRDYVFASVTWAKLAALVEGAKIASDAL